MKNDSLEKDVKSFLSLYSKFERINIFKKKHLILRGDIDVCDIQGNYLKTFEVDIFVDRKSYPYTIPLVKETSELIERDEDWHVSDEGLCCLDIDHKLLKMSQRGIHLSEFYQDIIYPFFCNTVFKQLYNDYANGEYPHEFNGVRSFYKSELKLEDPKFIIEILRSINIGKTPGRNQLCICGKTKYKKCTDHFESIQFLKSLPKKRVSKDLKSFEEEFLENGNKPNKSARIF